MILIGIISILITFSSLLMLALELLKGLTTCLKKTIFIQWIICISLTILTELFAIYSYNIIKNYDHYSDRLAANILEIFVIVNIIDLIFWTTGRCR
jgi:hypothetical protein